GIRAEAQTLSFEYRQPIIQTPTQELALSLTLDLEKSETFILNDIPYSFTEGPENGKSRVTAVRFTQEWINRSTQRVLAARAQLSFGLPWFDATVNESGIDGQFFSWVGQFQWAQKLGEDTLLVARFDAQLTPNSLLPLEQFTIGGVDTVIGYSRNARAGDNGINGSLEVHFTVLNAQDWGTLELVPFFNIGTVWNNRGEVFSPNTLASTGLGLRWQLRDFLFTRLDCGIPLSAVDDDFLQECSFSVRLQAKF
ncbi:MAG: ShlB/FhaC/HecB family hemolysin secretion/activation protein, partial [Microcystaceae cyanobacterium]